MTKEHVYHVRFRSLYLFCETGTLGRMISVPLVLKTAYLNDVTNILF